MIEICYIFYDEKNLKKHIKIHESEKQSCLYCNMKIKRALNLRFHQQTCEMNPNRKNNNLQHGAGVAGKNYSNDFEIVNSAFRRCVVLYRRKLDVNSQQIEDIRSIFRNDVKDILQHEVSVRKGIKWSLSLKVVMYKAADPSIVTDPPVAFNTDMLVGLIGSNYDEDLDMAFNNVIRKIEEYSQNGSGWVLSEFVEVDVTITTYTPWIRSNNDDSSDENESEEDEVFV